VSDCCSPGGYRAIFSERSARSAARRYRRRGLDALSRRMVELVKQGGVEGATVLEVGGGIGAIQIELLKAGAARAVSIELTPTYEEVADGLLRESGLEDRVERRVTDFAEAGELVAAADIVVMNRVVCCYGDMPKLTGAAAERAGRMLVMSFPRPTPWMRVALWLVNTLLRVSRREFHIFLHPPAGIVGVAEEHGLKTVSNTAGLLWQVAALERA
jgi:magnesium-protoporphyrin O-methyltransferase